MPAIDRQAPVGDQRLAYRAGMAEALRHAAEAEGSDVGAAVFQQRHAGIGFADLGNRRSYRHRHEGTVGDQFLRGRVPGGNPVDKIGIRQQWRAGKDERGDFRLVGSKPGDNLRRSVPAHGKGFRHGLAHLGGRIVEQQGKGRLGRAPVLEGKRVLHIGIGESRRGGSPFRHFRRADPFQEMRNNDHLRPTPEASPGLPIQDRIDRLIKRSPCFHVVRALAGAVSASYQKA